MLSGRNLLALHNVFLVMGYSVKPFSKRSINRSWLVTVLIAFLLLAPACSFLENRGELREAEVIFPTIGPSPTPDPRIAARWELDRDLIPIRHDWPRSTFHDQHEGCRDRGLGGTFRDGYMFIDIPPEPHTQEVVRKAVAEHLCFAGKAEYAPPGRLFIKPAHFTMIELQDWAGQMRSILPGIEITSMGYQNAFNRINVSILDLKHEYAAREKLEAAGIPQHAVHFQQGGYFIPLEQQLMIIR